MVTIDAAQRSAWRFVLRSLLAMALCGVVGPMVLAQPCATWQSVATGPTGRVGSAMASNAAGTQAWMFGGQTSALSFANDLWWFTGGAWSGPSVATNAPTARAYSASARTSSGKFLVFGGWLGGSTYSSQTYEYTNEATPWQLYNTGIPTARAYASMAYHAGLGQTILYGGYNGTTNFANTYRWDAPVWTSLGPGNPPARRSAAMAYDAARGVIVLFGGWDGTTYFNDTWEWNGSWTQRLVSGPTARAFATMVFDPAVNRIVVYGGIGSGGTCNNQTWEFDGNSWNAVTISGTPPVARGGAGGAIASDATGTPRPLLFGGGCATYRNDAFQLVRGTQLAFTQQPQSTTACVGGSVAFTVAVSGSTPITYQWRKDGVNIGGATSPTYTINPVQLNSAAGYSCRVTNACGSITSNTANLTVQQQPTIHTQPASQGACAGGAVSFTVSVNGGASNYRWRKGGVELSNGGHISGATTATLTINPFDAGDVGSYDVIVTNLCGNVTSNAASATLASFGPRVYVHPSATGAGDGSSWANAFTSLQTALQNIAACGPGSIEVWVMGFHRPAGSGGDPNATFQLRSGMAIYGGFNGTETALSQRSVLLNPTTLSGDLNLNDQPDFIGYDDNVRTVVTASGVDNSAVLDGFYIYGGNNQSATGTGGGVYALNGAPTIRNCWIRRNTIGSGGNSQGAGLGFENSAGLRPRLINCRIEDNLTPTDQPGLGAGIYVNGGGLTLVNCAIVNNTLDGGGQGGGLYGVGDVFELIGCDISGNYGSAVGGVSLSASTGVLIANTAVSHNNSLGAPPAGVLLSGTATKSVLNSIFWENFAQGGNPTELMQLTNSGGAMTINYSRVKNWTGSMGGSGNSGVDPLFIDGPAGNLRLQTGSTCIDAGTMTGYPADTYDLDGDANTAEPLDVDLDRNRRLIDIPVIANTGQGSAFIDIGPYEVNRTLKVTSTWPAGNGRGWTDGFTSIDEALSAAQASGGVFNEVWVRAGNYTPPVDPNVQRAATLNISGNLTLLGGFRGDELDAVQRNPAVNTAELSGDTLHDDNYPSPGMGLDENAWHIVTVASGSPVFDGFWLTAGRSDGAANPIGPALLVTGGTPTIRNCTFSGNYAAGGGAAGVSGGTPRIESCRFMANEAAASASGLRVETGGTAVLAGCTIDPPAEPNTVAAAVGGTLSFDTTPTALPADAAIELVGGTIAGPSSLELGAQSTLDVGGGGGSAASVITGRVSGLGTVHVAAGSRLELQAGGVMDLTDQPGGACQDPNAAPAQGAALLEGALHVVSGILQNAQVTINNEIVGGCGNKSIGGSLQLYSGATVRCNTIVSYGDRCYVFDPNVLPRPTVQNNAVTALVEIDEPNDPNRGETFELRTHDFNATDPNAGPQSGLHLLAASPGYADAFALDKLVIMADSRVTLTNRAKQVYELPQTSTPEALYVRQIVLEPNALLNTGLNRVYCQQLTDELGAPLDPNNLPGGRKLRDIPLLGYSLVVIDFESSCEFQVRVATRTKAPSDPPSAGGAVTRVFDFGTQNAYMVLDTLRAPGTQATSVAAHGSFARAAEDNVVITFLYRFRPFAGGGADNRELLVYLSDQPDLRDPADANEPNYVARILPPPSGFAGAPDSTSFATFHAVFPRGSLNFLRGTYVELELRGGDGDVLIDDWDPQIQCGYHCGDVTGPYGLDELDLLVKLYAGGTTLPASDPRECLDSRVSGDRYVDIQDVLGFEAFRSGALNDCSDGAGQRGGPRGNPVPLPDVNMLLVAGKPRAAYQFDDYLYITDPNGVCVTPSLRPASDPDTTYGYRGNGRLVVGPTGRVYQLHALQGLIRLDNAARTVRPQVFDGAAAGLPGTQIYVGINSETGGEFRGAPLADAVFDPVDPYTLYVCPVVVFPPGRTFGYRAAARLRLSPTDPNAVQLDNLYGQDPESYANPCHNTSPPEAAVCNAQNLREVDVDVYGNLLVLAATALNDNDWLLCYRADSPTPNATEKRISLSSLVTSPAQMLVSRYYSNKLYLVSSVEDLSGGATRLYTLTITRQPDQSIVSATLGSTRSVTNPTDPDPNFTSGLGWRGAITGLAENPWNGTLFIGGFTAPRLDFVDYDWPISIDRIGTYPTLARVAAGSSGTIASQALTCGGLTLPLSIAYVSQRCPGDADYDRDVDQDDLDTVLFHFGEQVPAETYGDLDADGDVDQDDIDLALFYFGSTCP